MARVLAIGDTHCPGMRKDYPPFLRKVARKYGCNRTVFIGDVVDFAAMSFHEKHPSLANVDDEFNAAKKQVAQLYRSFPKADWLIGNHDELGIRQAKTVGISPEFLKDFNQLWDVPGWRVHQRYSAIEIDGVKYSHGDQGKQGQFAAVKQSRENFQSWVSGHCHAEGGVWWSVNHNARVFGLNVGCGMDHKLLQFEYGRKFNRKPALGCGVVIDGKYAYFEPMVV